MTTGSDLKLLDQLLGHWITEATHPAMPGVVVHGTADVEWLEGQKFLIVRSRTDHPDFPDAISVIGHMDQDRADEKEEAIPEDSPMRMHYFDSRGVFRIQETSIDNESWKWWRIVHGFSQRFTGTFKDGGNTIDGISQLRRDDVNWVDDLKITYHRRD